MDYTHICVSVIEMKLMDNKKSLQFSIYKFLVHAKIIRYRSNIEKFTKITKLFFKYFCNFKTLKHRNILETFIVIIKICKQNLFTYYSIKL